MQVVLSFKLLAEAPPTNIKSNFFDYFGMIQVKYLLSCLSKRKNAVLLYEIDNANCLDYVFILHIQPNY